MLTTLVDWLNVTWGATGWTMSELARRAGISHATISLVLSGQQRPTFEFCVAIANALGEPPELVLRRAGLLPQLPLAVEEEHEVLIIIREQTTAVRQSILSMMRGLVRRSSPFPADPDLAELAAIYERLPAEWKPAFIDASKRFEQNAHAGESRIIGEEEQATAA